MKPIDQIVFGFSDAENYRRKENKDLFNSIFLRTDALDQILKSRTSFLIGDKGTGKTAYAVYLSNSPYYNKYHEKGVSDVFISLHKFIRETDYQKFISLKQKNNLVLSEYVDIWKVIIYLIMAGAISESASKVDYLIQYPKFGALRAAINQYYNNAFAPEIPTAFQFVEDSKVSSELVAKHLLVGAKIAGERASHTTSASNVFQTNLRFIERQFENVLRSMRLQENTILFVDGIDIRPESIPFPEYLDCVKGLANAVWSVNNDFFPSIKDSPGRLRVVLLVRPDIFNVLGLQNRNTKLRDNSVVLDWRTSYPEHRRSNLFALADRMFAVQQADYKVNQPIVGGTWDKYFPFDAEAFVKEDSSLTSFIVFLRYAFSRPRDILTMLDILGKHHQSLGRRDVFSYGDLITPYFKRTYGDYVLGEIKDSLSFYYNEDEFQTFLKFFESGSYKFDYGKYLESYSEIANFLTDQMRPLPEFMKSPEEFIQFLYDLNVISFKDKSEDGSEVFIRWCYRERSPTNVSPKIKLNAEYEIHYALTSVLNTGKPLRRNKGVKASAAPTARAGDPGALRGLVKFFNQEKNFGFIVSNAIPIDIYFSTNSILNDKDEIKEGQRVEFKLIKEKGGNRFRAEQIRMLRS